MQLRSWRKMNEVKDHIAEIEAICNAGEWAPTVKKQEWKDWPTPFKEEELTENFVTCSSQDEQNEEKGSGLLVQGTENQVICWDGSDITSDYSSHVVHPYESIEVTDSSDQQVKVENDEEQNKCNINQTRGHSGEAVTQIGPLSKATSPHPQITDAGFQPESPASRQADRNCMTVLQWNVASWKDLFGSQLHQKQHVVVPAAEATNKHVAPAAEATNMHTQNLLNSDKSNVSWQWQGTDQETREEQGDERMACQQTDDMKLVCLQGNEPLTNQQEDDKKPLVMECDEIQSCSTSIQQVNTVGMKLGISLWQKMEIQPAEEKLQIGKNVETTITNAQESSNVSGIKKPNQPPEGSRTVDQLETRTQMAKKPGESSVADAHDSNLESVSRYVCVQLPDTLVPVQVANQQQVKITQTNNQKGPIITQASSISQGANQGSLMPLLNSFLRPPHNLLPAEVLKPLMANNNVGTMQVTKGLGNAQGTNVISCIGTSAQEPVSVEDTSQLNSSMPIAGQSMSVLNGVCSAYQGTTFATTASTLLSEINRPPTNGLLATAPQANQQKICWASGVGSNGCAYVVVPQHRAYSRELSMQPVQDKAQPLSISELFMLQARNESSCKCCEEYTCPLCNETFQKQYMYKWHLYLHNRNIKDHYQYLCEICGKGFRLKFKFKTHLLHKHGKVFKNPTYCFARTDMDMLDKCHEYLICEICRQCFRLEHHLKAHLKKKHGKVITNNQYYVARTDVDKLDGPSFSMLLCEKCGETFKTKECLQSHDMQRHSESIIKRSCFTTQDVQKLGPPASSLKPSSVFACQESSVSRSASESCSISASQTRSAPSCFSSPTGGSTAVTTFAAGSQFVFSGLQRQHSESSMKRSCFAAQGVQKLGSPASVLEPSSVSTCEESSVPTSALEPCSISASQTPSAPSPFSSLTGGSTAVTTAVAGSQSMFSGGKSSDEKKACRPVLKDGGLVYANVCGICERPFSSRASLDLHLTSHKDFICPYVCGICAEGFSKLCLLEDHLKSHDLPKENKKTKRPKKNKKTEKPSQHLCFMCGKSCATPKALRTHFMKMHYQYQHSHIYLCDTCGLVSDVGGKIHSECLRKHRMNSKIQMKMNKITQGDADVNGGLDPRDDEKLDKPMYSCRICSTGILESQLVAHVMQHIIRELCCCAFCVQVLRDAWNVWWCKLLHCSSTQQKLFTCKVCLQIMTTVQDFEVMVDRVCKPCILDMGADKEEILCSEQHQYTCDLCGQGFHYKVILKKHIDTHINQRLERYICAVCGCSFKQYSSLMCQKKNAQQKHQETTQNGPIGKEFNAERFTGAARGMVFQNGEQAAGTSSGSKICGKQKLKIDLDRSAVTRLHCNACRKYFASLSALREHQLSTH